MNITSRPTHQERRCESTLSHDCNALWQRVRFETQYESSGSQQTPAVVFRCDGVPGSTLNTDTRYRYSVALTLPELLAGLASVPTSHLSLAVSQMFDLIPSLKPEADTLESDETIRGCGCVTPQQFAVVLNAITTGLVDAILRRNNNGDAFSDCDSDNATGIRKL